jgi:hypothetical protein
MSSLFWPFFGALLPRLRVKGNLSSAITSITDLRVECRTMLHKNRLLWTNWTTTQLQQGSERTRVKPGTSSPDSRALDRSKTNRLIPRVQLTACYDLCAACSDFTSSRRRARGNIAMLYCTSTMQCSTALLEEPSHMTDDPIRLRVEYRAVTMGPQTFPSFALIRTEGRPEPTFCPSRDAQGS